MSRRRDRTAAFLVLTNNSLEVVCRLYLQRPNAKAQPVTAADRIWRRLSSKVMFKNMKFSDLYNNCIKLWPNEIHIGDGYPTGKSGYRFPELVTVHDRIEENIPVEDGWLQIIDWSMFQAFHAESKRLIQNNEKTLNPRSVAKSEVQWRVSENLRGEGWESLRAEYVNDLQET